MVQWYYHDYCLTLAAKEEEKKVKLAGADSSSSSSSFSAGAKPTAGDWYREGH